MVHEAIKERGDDDDIPEEARPVVEWAIRGDHRGPFLVTRHEDVGQFVTGSGRELPQKEIVDE